MQTADEQDLKVVSALTKAILQYGYKIIHHYHYHLRYESEKDIYAYHTEKRNFFENYVSFSLPLYHYTNLPSCEKILTNDNIRMYESKSMNDKLEGVFGQKLLSSLRNPFHPRETTHIQLSAEEMKGYDLLANDDFNFSYNQRVLQKLNRYIEKFKIKNSSLLFLSCFSHPQSFNVFDEKQNCYENLSMWIAYGRNGKGVCLEIERNDLNYQIGKSDVNLFPVIYDQDSQLLFLKYICRMLHDLINKNNRIISFLTNLADNYAPYSTNSYIHRCKNFQPLVNSVFKMYVSLMKHPCFANENEWRLIYMCHKSEKNEYEFTKHGRRKLAYVSFQSKIKPERIINGCALPFRKIILGPTLPLKTKEAFTKGLDQTLERKIAFINSELPYIS